jgi:hypothetical protein
MVLSLRQIAELLAEHGDRWATSMALARRSPRR